MSIYNAGACIREARLKAKLTQNELSEGICSALSLSRIENGSAGVSPSTFQALMARAGASCEAFPAFASRRDFDCFYSLKRARFFLDSWQLQSAYEELCTIENSKWANNRFYYQEWLMLYCKLQTRSHCTDHDALCRMVLCAMHISRPNFTPDSIPSLLLSPTELELCILLAQEYFYLESYDNALLICAHISDYLSNMQASFLDKDLLLAENAIVYCKYLLNAGRYDNALTTADTHRRKMTHELIDSPLHELTFLTALGYYYTDDNDKFYEYFKMAFLSAHSIESCYATVCRDYVRENLSFDLPEALSAYNDIPIETYPFPKNIDTSSMGDGAYDLFSPDALPLGSLIRTLRMERHISQDKLCFGLCSKSKLSKIENNTLQPSISLSRTLLQRLGISDLPFAFYGAERENKLEELNLKLLKIRETEKDKIIACADELISLCKPSDIHYLQYAFFRKALCNETSSDKISGLKKTLDLTLPNFDFNDITSLRLSHMEISILNNLCICHADENPPVGIRYFFKLLEYYEIADIDCMEARRFMPVTIGMLVRKLYTEKRHSEVCELSKSFSSQEIKSSLYFTGHIFFHYCQSLGELGRLPLAEKYGNYARQNMMTEESYDNAKRITNFLKQDFNIELL